MIGAITGDIVGSVYEWKNLKNKSFDFFSSGCFFTDDTVLTVALADSILSHKDYALLLRSYYHRYRTAGYGGMFRRWADTENSPPYNSYGNGAAMRISPVGFSFSTLETVLEKAKQYTEVTHNHPEGIKGAQATAASIFLARTGETKTAIREYVSKTFGYDLSETVEDIRPWYEFDETCQGTVPQAIIAFLDSNDFEDAIRNAISLGGDSDTLACITGGIAQAFYGVPDWISQRAMSILDLELRMVVSEFEKTYPQGK
ncbi:ADP-ribosylglycohydrolase family protein [Gammaproteobacteria bacterium]